MGKVTDGGIIIPDGVKDFFNTLVAKVIATGKDCKQVKVGDNVLLYHSVQRGIVRYKNEKCTQVEEEFIAGILNADEVVELPLKSES
jgi:co-chaperonin GroES (HSP10)